MVPIQNPISNALVGLLYPANPNEFERRWRDKFGSVGQVNAPTSFGSTGTTKSTPDSPIIGDAQKKEAAKQLFLDEVSKLQNAGHGYTESWLIAGQNEPGRSFFEAWTRGSDKMSMSNQAPDSPPASTDRYDPKLEQKIRQKFVDLTKRLALEGAHRNSAEIWAFASTQDPVGKQLYQQWVEQITLKKRYELAGRQQFHKGPEAHPETI